MAGCTIQIRTVLVNNVGMELSEKLTLADAATEVPILIQSIFNIFVVP